MNKHILTTAIASMALATVCACNKDNSDRARTNVPADQTPIARNAPAERQDVNSPITVTGCLQKAGSLMTTYIVTGVNEPAEKNVGTSGSAAAVEREQLREAASAYRVSPKDKVDMDAMVGKQVRVSGTIAKRADLPAIPNQTGAAGDKRPATMDKIDTGDLAKIDDASIAVVSDSCSGNEKAGAKK